VDVIAIRPWMRRCPGRRGSTRRTGRVVMTSSGKGPVRMRQGAGDVGESRARSASRARSNRLVLAGIEAWVGGAVIMLWGT
jgi:hypothetical protein